MTSTPPPVLDGARVLEYAVIDETVKFTGKLHLYVGGERVGPVPRLAICESLDDGQLILFHCDEAWNVVGAQLWNAPEATAVTSVQEVKIRAESYYTGIVSKWVPHDATVDEAKAYQAAIIGDRRCSFCGRTAHEVRCFVEAENGSRICDLCIAKLHQQLSGE